MHLKEFTSACNGYLIKHGKGKKAMPLTRNEMKELMKQHPD